MEHPCALTIRGQIPSVRHLFHHMHIKRLRPDSAQNKQPGDEHANTPTFNYTTPPTAARGSHKWLLVGPHSELMSLIVHTLEMRGALPLPHMVRIHLHVLQACALRGAPSWSGSRTVDIKFNRIWGYIRDYTLSMLT